MVATGRMSVALADSIMARFPNPDDIPFRPWCYVQGYVLSGFEMLYEYTAEVKYLDYLLRFVDQHVEDGDNIRGFTGHDLDNIMAGTTVIHETIGRQGASRVLIKPAAPGTGVIAGGAMRQILEAAGIRDVLAKSLGSPTHVNVARATIHALFSQQRPDQTARRRGKTAEEVTPPGLLAAYRTAEMMRAQPGSGS